MGEIGLTAALTAIISVGVLLASKFKCLYENGSCKCGITENPISDTQDIKLDSIKSNGIDLVYVSKNNNNNYIIDIESESESECELCI
jgi:hypothetical protein